MQTDERVTCPSCGGENPKAAAFCWRCYANLDAVPPIPGGTARAAGRTSGRIGLPPMPDHPLSTVPSPSATSANGRSSTWLRVLIGALVSLGAVLAMQAVFGGHPSLPDTLAGIPRLTTPEAKDFEQQMADYGDRSDVDVTAGAYGTGVTPSFFVLLIEARSIEATDAIFTEFVNGMASSGATVGSSETTSGERDGLEYRCVPVSASQLQAAACLWRDDGTFGVVFRFGAGIDETTDLLVKIHQEVA